MVDETSTKVDEVNTMGKDGAENKNGETLASAIENLNLRDTKEEEDLVRLTEQLNIESKKHRKESPKSDEENKSKGKKYSKEDKKEESVKDQETSSESDEENKDEDIEDVRKKTEEENDLDLQSKRDESAESDIDNEEVEDARKIDEKNAKENKDEKIEKRKGDEEKKHNAEEVTLKERGGARRNPSCRQRRAHPYNVLETYINRPELFPDYISSEPDSPYSMLSGASSPTSPQQVVPDMQTRSAMHKTQKIDHYFLAQSPHDPPFDLVMDDGLHISFIECMRNSMGNREEIEKFRRDFRNSADKVYTPDEDGDTILMCLIANSHPLEAIYALVEMIIEEQPYFINLANMKSQTALYTAIYYNRWMIAGYLIERGADPNVPTNRKGDTALHFACRRGYMESIKALLTALPGETGYQLDINKTNNLEETPLEVALKNNCIAREEIVRLLVRHGAKPEIEHSGLDMEGRPTYKSLMHFLISNQDLEMVNVCLENSTNPAKLASLYYREEDKTTLLHLVVTDDKMSLKTKTDFVKLLISYGADPTPTDYLGMRAVDHLQDNDIEISHYLYLPETLNGYY